MSTEQTYFVANAEDRIHQLPRVLPPEEQDPKPEHDKLANVLKTSILKFLPGLNLKTESELRAHRFDLAMGGALRIIDVSTLSFYEARSWIDKTTHRGTLLAWRQLAAARADEPDQALIVKAIDDNLRSRGDRQREDREAGN